MRTRPRIASRLTLGIATVALAGCTTMPDTVGPTPSEPADAGPAPAAMTDCGTFNLMQGESPPVPALQCFVDGVSAGRPVQLKVTRPTVEGDPVPVTYQADATGRTILTMDSRQDDYGAQVVTRQVCTGPRVEPGRLEFAHCSSAEVVG